MRVAAKFSDLTADAQGLLKSGVNHYSLKVRAPYIRSISKIRNHFRR